MDENLLAMMNSLDDTALVREDYKRIPFSYPGSKTDSLPYILPELPYENTFVDVFGGSGVVTLNRRPCKLDVFNDRCSGVTCFFRVVRDKDLRQQLIERIALTPHSREEFMWANQTWKDCNDPLERAARWYTMVQSSFAGRGRYFGRVLKGRGSMWAKIQENLDLFDDLAHRFLTIQIENLDWRHCLKDYDSHTTVFYLDPPYVSENIYEHGMSVNEHIEMCERIFHCDGFVALSGYDNPIYEKFPWDRKLSWEVTTLMATQATKIETSVVQDKTIKRGKATENLWIKDFIK